MKKKLLLLILSLALIVTAIGAITIGAGAEASAPELSIAYCNLSFQDNVYIKYAVKSDVADVKLLIWTSPRAEYLVGTQDDEITEYYTDTIDGGEYMIFDYTELAAKQMTDVVYACAYAQVGGVDYYSEVNKYSILQYAYNMLGKTAEGTDNAELKDMLTSMLTYGASAQKYFDYNETRLATADWYQIKVTAGELDDGSTHGLYLPGDQIMITAPATDASGLEFSGWIDGEGNRVSDELSYVVTVGSENEVYTPVYAHVHVEAEAVVENETAPDCENAGSYDVVVYCSECGEELSRETVTVDALGHTEGEAVVENSVAASCAAAGSYDNVVYCTVCGEELSRETVVVPAGEHTVVVDEAVAPSCTETGLTAGSHCGVCGETLVAQETVDALGHTEVVDEAVAPSCTETGLTAGSHCGVCGETLVAQEAVDALGHTEAEAVVENEVAADCTNAGSYDSVVYCSVCGEELSRETVTVDALGHTEAEAVVENEVAADCTTAGSYETVVYCSVCGEELSRETVTVDALGHTEVVDEAVAPSCTETGLTAGSHCGVCGETIVAQEAVEALGHTVVDLEAVAPTCTETGLTAGAVCGVCGETLIAQKVVPAAHTVVRTSVAVDDSHTQYTYACSVCETVLSRKTLANSVYYADITTVTATHINSADYVEDRTKAPVYTLVEEDGLLYTHVSTEKNQVETVIKAENVPASAVIYVKYRLANGGTPEGWIHSSVKITDASGVEHLISDGTVENADLIKRHNSDLANDGWIVARVNAKGAFDREGLVAGSNALAYTFTIVHSDDLDIAYFVSEPTEDNVNGLPFVYSMGDDYYLHCSTVLGSYIDSQWRLINGTSGTKQNDPFTPSANTRTPVYVEEAVKEEVEHEIVYSTTVNADGTTTHTYTCNCEECAGAVLYRKTLKSNVFHADITTITAVVTQGEGEAEVSQEIAEDGMLYTHVATHGNWVTTTISADDVPAGMVMYVKYRLANGGTPEGYMASQVNVTTADGKVHLVSSGTVENADLIKNHKGWLVARVNVKGNFTTEGLTSGAVVSNVTMTITHRDDLDIAYFIAEPTEDNVNGLPYVYSMGDDYYLHSSTYLGWYTASQWRLINGTSGTKQNDPFTPPAPTRTPVYVEEAPAGEVEHNIVFNKADNGNGTTTYTYTCDCAECEGAVLYKKTLNSTVFHADITTVTASLTADGTVSIPVSTEIADDGMVYSHVDANGRQTTTVISAENVPAGMVMYVKYRLNNGSAPEGWIHSRITVTTADGVEHLVSDGKVENEDLVKRHTGWVVSRINVKGNFTTEGLTSGAVVSKVTLTITHSDDLDIQYFIAEAGENNADGLPYVYSMGDDYYLHVSTVLGSYIDSQWRLINGTSGVKQNDPFTPPASTRTPVYVEQ